MSEEASERQDADVKRLRLRVVVAIPLIVGAFVAGGSDFAAPAFMAGSMLHLVGLALCAATLGSVHGIQSRRSNRTTPRSPQSTKGAMNGVRRRAADLEPRIQFIRVLAALLLVSVIAATGARTAIDLFELALLHRKGKVVEAQVFNKVRATELGNAATGRVYYSFRAAGMSVTGSFRAARADYPSFRTGRYLTATYLPTSPQIHRLGLVDGERFRQEGCALLLLFLCRAADIGVPVFVLERALRWQLRLARYGISVTGVIVGCKPLVRAGRRVGYRIGYEYEVPGGGIMTGSGRIGQVEGEPTLVGFPLTVLYDPGRPDVSRPLASFYGVRFRGLQRMLLAS